ncbi:hypothetical protein GWK47_004203 [Chionoecetes opilio]|uniref:Uncharacterized protein n=1 Tax=Chionoecetes opilio TaxID=41210 RepID=A0A8J4YHN3_CHIOP|nr:hypothetical protein GWK47_004203 [Chionoecetes opilio]
MGRWRLVSLVVVVVAVCGVKADESIDESLPPTTLPELPANNTANDTGDPLMVGSKSKYCNWERAMGPVCVFNTTKKVVVVPEGLQFSSGQLELEIYNATVVKLYPACRFQNCRTWLRIYDSNVGRVEHGVKDLTLQDTHVDTIKLLNQRDFMAINSTINEIEELDWGGYRSTVLNTSIGWLAGIHARDSWYVVDGRFGTVASGGIVFNAKEMSIINSTINHMSSKALTITSGTASFTNVTIAYLEAWAVTVTSPTGFLSLSNITIGAAIAPCFVLLDRKRLTLNNVTVLGININETSTFFHFLDDAGVNVSESTSIGDQSEECVSNDTMLFCNFAQSKKDVAIVGEDIKNYKAVQVRNAKSLLVSSTGCQTDLRLENVNATLPHLTALPDDTTGEICNVSISIKNSSLNVVWTKNITHLNVTTSTIKRIHGGSLDSFVLSESSVEEIDEVVIQGRGAVWKKSLFLSSISVILKAPLTSSSISLPQSMLGPNALTIDHPGQTTTLKDWSMNWMRRHSVVVKNGSRLELSDMVAVRVAQEAIYLEEGATASSKNFRILQDSVYIFSVASRSQEEVTVDFANSQVSNRVIIKGAASVKLFPSCVEKIILMNIKTASTTENERDCGTWLEALGVHLTNVTSGVHDVTLKSCTVDLLAPDRRLRDVDLEGTSVERVVGVHWAGYTGVFNSSRLGEVKSMRADSRLMMSNSTVETLVAGGMFLAAEAIIVNTTFKNIHTSGMTVNGSTRMQDVTIEKLEKGVLSALPPSRTPVTTTTTTTEQGRHSPQASSIIQWRTTSAEVEARSSVAPDALAAAATTTSWKWAGAGIGFCLGLVVGCCIFIFVKVVKPNRGMLSMPTVFWRVKEDQHELLQEDQAGGEESTATRRDQGYSVLPRTDIS